MQPTMESPKPAKPKHMMNIIRYVLSPSGVRIALSLADSATDFYTAYRYSIMSGPWKNLAFYGLLASLLFHNIISSIHGLWNLFAFHKSKPLGILDSAWWRLLLIVAHLLGLGSVTLPLTLIFSAKFMDEGQFKARYSLHCHSSSPF